MVMLEVAFIMHALCKAPLPDFRTYGTYDLWNINLHKIKCIDALH